MDAVVINNLSKRFGEKNVLEDVHLTIKKGEILGLLGPNGAGKTTLISIMAGITTPTRGTITVFGHDVERERTRVQQSLNMVRGFGGVLHGFTVVQLMRYYALLYEVPFSRIEPLLKRTGMWEKRAEKVSELSSGWRQRFFIAKALLNEPKLLLLDEPTVGLDIDVAKRVRELIKELKAEGYTILLTTHYMQEAEELCDRIAVISRGNIVALGTPKQLRSLSRKRGATLEHVFLTLTKEEPSDA